MGNVRRIYVEKKEPFAVKAKELHEELKNYLGIDGLKKVREFIRYDVENISDEVFEKACPLFVPLAEDGWTDNEVAYKTASLYLNEMVENGVDCIVLGCTHYPLLKKCIGETVGESIKLVDPAKEAALEVKKFLTENNSLRMEKKAPGHVFYVSDKTDIFGTMCEKALKKVYTPEEIDIEKY